MDDRTGFTEEEMEKGIAVTEYFYDKYGEKRCKFIMSKIASSTRNYSKEDLISLGDKIALFNSWITFEEAKELEKKGVMRSK